MIRLFAATMLCFSIWTGCASADDEDMISVEADQVVYLGAEVLLSGNVHVEHDLGMLFSDKMILRSQERLTTAHFDQMEMVGNARILMGDGALLTCHHASIDAKCMSGLFLGEQEEQFVIFTDHLQPKDGHKTPRKVPLVVQSRRMNMRLFKVDGKKDESVRMSISDLMADEDVSVIYNNDLTATSDHADYRRDLKNYEGVLIMRGDTPERLCKVTNATGDVIEAVQINIDTQTKQLIFTRPKGVINSARGKSSAIDFSSNILTWNDVSNFMTLSGDVKLSQPGVGQLQAAKDVQITFKTVDGKKMVHVMETKGQSELNYTDEESNLNHKLKCYGSLKVDHQKMESRLQSPKDLAGNIVEGRQVFFEDEKGEIFADRAFVKYENVDSVIVPVRVVLEGNVTIKNRIISEKDQPPAQQYILAERVEFLPRTKEMTLKAAKGQRVLLFDKTNNLQVSAPAIKLTRDLAAKKESVQGLGDVRFNFVEDELLQLRKHFSFDKEESAKLKSTRN